MSTPAEFIGAGWLAKEHAEPDGPMQHPEPFDPGTHMGQHLSVERLVRVGEGRMVYLVNNLSRKWSRRKCWACGNKYSPDSARCCTYCGSKLEDLRFLMTARWNQNRFEGFEEFARQRVKHFGLVAPVFAFYRRGLMMAVYHYDGGALLVDFPAPLPGTQVLQMTAALADTLAHLHEHGVVLRPVDALNVLVMPDGTPRWFDLAAERVVDSEAALRQDPDRPIQRDVQRLARLLRRYCPPHDTQAWGLLDQAARGAFADPVSLRHALHSTLRERVHADPPPSTPAAAYTDLGLYRARNEDGWVWRRYGDRVTLYAVADGMGGEAFGAEASQAALETLRGALADAIDQERPDPEALARVMVQAFRRANEQVWKERNRRGSRMGCTLTALLVIDGDKLVLAHVGDTRAYQLRKGELTQLTVDHTVAQFLLEDGEITPEEAETHRARHILVNAIGGEAELDRVDVRRWKATSGDRLMLCSDGLSGEVEAPVMARHLGWNDRHKAVRELVREVYDHGGHDNVTVLVLDIP